MGKPLAADLAFPRPGPRVVVVGATGSGKTTTARRIGILLGIPHIELDAIHWQANWVMMETEAFREQVRLATAGEAWVVDGNYNKAADIFWPRATTVVWLDYPAPVIFWQLTTRTFARLFSREVLWNENRESWRGMFLSRDSLFLWFFQSFHRIRRRYAESLSLPENAHLQVIRLRSRRETQRWLASLAGRRE